jgi:multidrug efflux pump subunit AcrB
MSVVVLGSGAWFGSQLKSQFFPIDLQYLAYVDVWLPEDSPLSATAETTEQVEAIIRRVAADFAERQGAAGGPRRDVLRSLTTFIGGGGPRFWYSVGPEQSQLNYSQVLFEVFDKHDTRDLSEQLQLALDAESPAPASTSGSSRPAHRSAFRYRFGSPATTSPPCGPSRRTRRRASRHSDRRRRARQLGTRKHDRAAHYRHRSRQHVERHQHGRRDRIVNGADRRAADVTSRGRRSDPGDGAPPHGRARGAVRHSQPLRVLLERTAEAAPRAISSIDYRMQSEKLQRRNQFRTITVSAFPAAGHLSSEVLEHAMPRFEEIERNLPPGYRFEIGGEYEEQVKGFVNLTVVMVLSVTMIFIALVVQFRNAIKPFIVFAAIPYGFAGALAALWLMGAPFGFMAFLGIVSLVGVIVSHIIVLFDFIEEMHEQGQPLEEALLNAGIVRLRPVLITVAATVFALIPLALHGGPLWEPMCYAQIGGLTVATFVTLIVVPVLYAICVRDLKIVSWSEHHGTAN